MIHMKSCCFANLNQLGIAFYFILFIFLFFHLSRGIQFCHYFSLRSPLWFLKLPNIKVTNTYKHSFPKILNINKAVTLSHISHNIFDCVGQ